MALPLLHLLPVLLCLPPGQGVGEHGDGFARVSDHKVLGVLAQPRARQRLRFLDGLDRPFVHGADESGKDRLALGLNFGREL